MNLDEAAKRLGYVDADHVERNIEAYGEPLPQWWEVIKELVNKLPLNDVISCLPTDVEISDYSKQKYLYRKSPCGTYYEGKQKGFYEGAEWLKDKLNNL